MLYHDHNQRTLVETSILLNTEAHKCHSSKVTSPTLEIDCASSTWRLKQEPKMAESAWEPPCGGPCLTANKVLPSPHVSICQALKHKACKVSRHPQPPKHASPWGAPCARAHLMSGLAKSSTNAITKP